MFETWLKLYYAKFSPGWIDRARLGFFGCQMTSSTDTKTGSFIHGDSLLYKTIGNWWN